MKANLLRQLGYRVDCSWFTNKGDVLAIAIVALWLIGASLLIMRPAWLGGVFIGIALVYTIHMRRLFFAPRTIRRDDPRIRALRSGLATYGQCHGPAEQADIAGALLSDALSRFPEPQARTFFEHPIVKSISHPRQ